MLPVGKISYPEQADHITLLLVINVLNLSNSGKLMG